MKFYAAWWNSYFYALLVAVTLLSYLAGRYVPGELLGGVLLVLGVSSLFLVVSVAATRDSKKRVAAAALAALLLSLSATLPMFVVGRMLYWAR